MVSCFLNQNHAVFSTLLYYIHRRTKLFFFPLFFFFHLCVPLHPCSKVPDAVIDSSLDFVSRKAHGSTGKGLAAQALGAKGHTKGSMYA